MKFLVVCESYGPGFYTTGIAEGLERLGHAVKYVTANVWGMDSESRLFSRIGRNDNVVLSAAGEFRPDALFIAKGDAISGKALDRIKKAGVLTVVWQIDDPMFFDGVSLRHSCDYDMVYTTEKNSLPLYMEHGIRARWLPFGYDEACRGRRRDSVVMWRDGVRKGVVEYLMADVAFVGDPLVEYPGSNRHVTCARIKDALPALRLLGCDKTHEDCGDWEGRVELSDMETVVSRTKINLAFADQAQGAAGMKMRHVEIPGYGGFMLAEDFDYLGELFVRGQEIETFSSADECVKKIKYYLKHDKKREKIRMAGQARANRDHTYTVRAKELAADVERKLADGAGVA